MYTLLNFQICLSKYKILSILIFSIIVAYYNIFKNYKINKNKIEKTIEKKVKTTNYKIKI